MPRLGDFMREGALAKWAKAPGEPVAQGETVAEIESEKVNYDLEAAQSGILYVVVPEGATVPVDSVIGYLLAEGESPPDTPAPQPAPSKAAARRGAAPREAAARVTGDTVASTPGARRLAARLGVNISQVTPTGPRGRVVEADVRGYHERKESPQTPKLPHRLPKPAKTVPLEGVRKRIAERMRYSLTNTAQLTFVLEVDVTEAQRLRRELSKDTHTTIALAHMLIKACAETLRRIPAANAVLADGNIHYFDEVNIGVAVAMKNGLIVPVLRNVEKMDILEISRGTEELAKKARSGKLTPDDVLGGTFSISVLGIVDAFTPILYAGQSAILGVGRSVEKPVVSKGEVVVREMMTFSLTIDHQVLDGAVAASFLRRLRQAIERPAALLK